MTTPYDGPVMMKYFILSNRSEVRLQRVSMKIESPLFQHLQTSTTPKSKFPVVTTPFQSVTVLSNSVITFGSRAYYGQGNQSSVLRKGRDFAHHHD
jgi:hypothetical protein